MAQFFTIAASARTTAEAVSTVFMYRATSGAWLVRDEDDRKGGVFATNKAARAFIKREFSNRVIVINANLAATTTREAA